MCGIYCIAFIEHMLAARKTNLFSPNNYKKNDKIIYKYFKDKYDTSEIQTEKIDEARNCLLEEIKQRFNE